MTTEAARPASRLRFEVLGRAGAARRGRLTTPRGAIETPAFMPVGTLGAVKGVAPEALEDAGAEIMLCNLYHLAVRPGIDTIERLGGVHQWNGWRRPYVSDRHSHSTGPKRKWRSHQRLNAICAMKKAVPPTAACATPTCPNKPRP